MSTTISDLGDLLRVQPALYRAFWHDLWTSRVTESPQLAAGRGAYDDDDLVVLIADTIRGLDLRPTDSLLDIGCAKGFVGDKLRQLVRRYVGLDYIVAFKPTVAGDAVSLPFQDGAFDKVLMAGVLVCIPPAHNAAALKELRRVTRPSGRAFVASNPFRRVHQMAQVYKESELADLARACGWDRATCVGINPKLEQSIYYFDMVLE